jgi:hypothetical protein
MLASRAAFASWVPVSSTSALQGFSIVRPGVVRLPTLGDTIDLTGLFGPD